MALSPDSAALIKRLNDASNEVAADIATLLANPNTTEAEFRTALLPVVEFLEKLGADTNAPIPTT